jgi:hypothetical protein
LEGQRRTAHAPELAAWLGPNERGSGRLVDGSLLLTSVLEVRVVRQAFGLYTSGAETARR